MISGHYSPSIFPVPVSTSVFVLFSPLAHAGLDTITGKHHLIFQWGQQSNAGPPLLRSSFFEAKLEVPLPSSSLTYKHTLFFDSQLMTFSSRWITGLRSIFISPSTSNTALLYEIPDWIRIHQIPSSSSAADNEVWSIERIRAVTSSWWYGQSTGKTLTRFITTPVTSPTPVVIKENHSLSISFNLVSFLSLSIEEIQSRMGVDRDLMSAEGWYTVESDCGGWQLDDAWKMETKRRD